MAKSNLVFSRFTSGRQVRHHAVNVALGRGGTCDVSHFIPLLMVPANRFGPVVIEVALLLWSR